MYKVNKFLPDLKWGEDNNQDSEKGSKWSGSSCRRERHCISIIGLALNWVSGKLRALCRTVACSRWVLLKTDIVRRILWNWVMVYGHPRLYLRTISGKIAFARDEMAFFRTSSVLLVQYRMGLGGLETTVCFVFRRRKWSNCVMGSKGSTVTEFESPEG